MAMLAGPPDENVCGLYFLQAKDPVQSDYCSPFSTRVFRKYLPLVSLSAHTTILSSISRTGLIQTFANPSPTAAIPELRYTFPLYDGVCVVGFTCTINNARVIRGVVQETQAARQTFTAAVARGETAGLLEQQRDASDVFTTTIGNVPAGAEIRVDIVVLGELKHDAGVDGIRFTLPTSIAPRYGSTSGGVFRAETQASAGAIAITVDVEMQPGSAITSLQSPSHPIGVEIGSVSSTRGRATAPPPQFNLASASLSLGTASLDKDFVLQIVATNASDPVAILETHSTIHGQRALMATLVPKFNLPSERPEIVFVCDQSGSMQGQKIANLRSALQLFLKSLPVGVKFNICSFGNNHSFLFPQGSRTYDADSLGLATQYVAAMQANYGGTKILQPVKATLDKRAVGLDLEVFVLTDGQVWNQNELFDMVNTRQKEAPGSIRVFTLGIGAGASSALVEGLARAGNGFCQTVGDHEKLDNKVVRMLKAALTTHITDFTLEVKYRKPDDSANLEDDDFELIDRVADLTVDVGLSDMEQQQAQDCENSPPEPISLFDPSLAMESSTDNSSSLPTIAAPRILQAPSQIPALFPFHRTNVYLLLSPATAATIPETVTLRATSKHGPLVLEIPVTTPTGASSSDAIHQLAARKATRELEEGRGWLVHAKHGDKLLKEAYPAHFDDIVQREAVRLGVEYQVGGKWCSFVAVEGDGREAQPAQRPVRDVDEGPAMANDSYSQNSVQICRTNPFGSAAHAAGSGSGSAIFSAPQNVLASFSRPSNADSPASARPALSSPSGIGPASSSSGGSGSSLFGSRPNATTSAGGLFGSGPSNAGSPASAQPNLFGGNVHAFGAATSSSGISGPALFGPIPMANPMAENSVMAMSMPTAARQQHAQAELHANAIRDHMLSAEPDQLPHRKKKSAGTCMHRVSLGTLAGISMLGASPTSPAPTAPDETPMETIVRLQSFDGFWTWSDALAAVLGVKDDELKASLGGESFSSDVRATIAAIAFLRTVLGAERDAWELVADKALAWLLAQEAQGGVGWAEVVEQRIRDVGSVLAT